MRILLNKTYQSADERRKEEEEKKRIDKEREEKEKELPFNSYRVAAVLRAQEDEDKENDEDEDESDEDVGPSKDRTRMKKSKATVKEFDSKSNRELSAKSASDHASYYGDSRGKDLKLLKLGITDCIDEQGRDTGSDEDASKVNKAKSSVTSLKYVSEALSSEISGLNYSVDVALVQDKIHTAYSNAAGSSPVANVVPPLVFVQDDASEALLENKGKPVDDRGIKGASERQTTGLHRSESVAEEIANSSLEAKDNEQHSNEQMDSKAKVLEKKRSEVDDHNDDEEAPVKENSGGVLILLDIHFMLLL
ncbi:hypothetical protein Drorol1_Dr00012667 [Drosera rotundifolia]